MTELTEGMGITVGIGSDCYPYTLVDFSIDGKTIKIQRDHYEPAEGYDFYGNQVYNYTPDPNAPVEVWTLRNNGRYVRKGETKVSGYYLSIGTRKAYRDPSF